VTRTRSSRLPCRRCRRAADDDDDDDDDDATTNDDGDALTRLK
jgi:hypothetical protein